MNCQSSSLSEFAAASMALSTKELINMDTEEARRKLTKLKRSRTGKKGAITKRIAQLNGMAEAGGMSRRQMRYMMEKLIEVYSELEKVCDEITDISELFEEIDDLNCIEDVRMNVDTCVALVTEHIESRQDELSSSFGSVRTLSWVANLPIASYEPEVDNQVYEAPSSQVDDISALEGAANPHINVQPAEVSVTFSDSNHGELPQQGDVQKGVPPEDPNLGADNQNIFDASDQDQSDILFQPDTIDYNASPEHIQESYEHDQDLITGISLQGSREIIQRSHEFQQGSDHEERPDSPILVPRRDHIEQLMIKPLFPNTCKMAPSTSHRTPT